MRVKCNYQEPLKAPPPHVQKWPNHIYSHLFYHPELFVESTVKDHKMLLFLKLKKQEETDRGRGADRRGKAGAGGGVGGAFGGGTQVVRCILTSLPAWCLMVSCLDQRIKTGDGRNLLPLLQLLLLRARRCLQQQRQQQVIGGSAGG